MIRAIGRRVADTVTGRKFRHLDSAVIELNHFRELMKVYGWRQEPLLDRPDMYDFDYVEDVNERRIRDAESLATVMRNVSPKVALEIGTANGMATLLMSVNAPETSIFTINIPPEELAAGGGGTLTTVAMEREVIGSAFRERNRSNITQIYANSATWTPDIGTIDVAFIDGCHDTDYVFNDTRKILPHMRPGGFIIWHDFNPHLVKKYPWIDSVCLGVEKLYRKGLIGGRIFHIRDSWMGICRVPE
ncbi:class I SAM-dependent methyltransferase [Geomonas subterranea]|uniref:Class I SAM-dependent methyltransferase n=1 Tax=Geomonas subterranea TaxID=2847989 RepID=A0ABX8LNQ9_9BACT|nr:MULTISPECIES: class I SAM-dependent methyltransferase [Geomonas]QXE92335.1 class I SAM-dependent methyltransferase [Geomonas subterranea]QXM09566.1 class I SAM-dependent methyltransferase [Geomonas subterranea]